VHTYKSLAGKLAMAESELGELAGWRGADLLAELPACAAEDAEEQQVPEEVVAWLMNAHEMCEI
jgi:hypothetical protein